MGKNYNNTTSSNRRYHFVVGTNDNNKKIEDDDDNKEITTVGNDAMENEKEKVQKDYQHSSDIIIDADDIILKMEKTNDLNDKEEPKDLKEVISSLENVTSPEIVGANTNFLVD